MTGRGSLEGKRQLNRLRVLDVIRRRGFATRTDITVETGLSRTTVSGLVGRMMQEGLVIERTDLPSVAPTPAGGRPPVWLALDPSSGAVLGIDFAHDHVRVALTDLSYKVLAEGVRRMDVGHHAIAALNAAAELVTAVLAEAGMDRATVIGAGAAVSAPLRHGRDVIDGRGIFPSWSGLHVAEELERRLGVSVYVGNDADLGALAESTFGAGRECRNLVYVMLSAGVGAGLIINGEPYRGHTGRAGEIGHIVVAPDGLLCRCGNRGCLETIASTAALTTTEYLGDLIAAAERGDPAAHRTLNDAGHAVGRALSSICSTLDPGMVVIGGELAAAGDPLLIGVQTGLSRGMPPSADDGVRVLASALGERAEVLGAVALVISSTPAMPRPPLADHERSSEC